MKKVIIITALLLLFCISTFGQNVIKTYTGKMKAPEDIPGDLDQGKVTYSYYDLQDGQRIKHGQFQFEEESITFSYKSSVQGAYKDGKKDGVWTFIGRSTKTGVELERFTINYKDDLIHGVFIGARNDIMFNIECSGVIKNSHHVGEVKIVVLPPSKGILKASFNELGWAHGTWIIERGYGIPAKQEREYYEGILLKVTELDLSTGKKTILFELPEATANAIKNTLNMNDFTLMISGERYKHIRRSDNNINVGFGVSASGMFNTYGDIIPMVNGFANIKKDYEWSEAKYKEERRIREEEKVEEKRVAEENRQEEFEKRAEEERIAEYKKEKLKALVKTVFSNDRSLTALYISQYDGGLRYTIRKSKIYNAYKLVYDKIVYRDIESVKNVIEIQEVLKQLRKKRTRHVEKALEDKQTVAEISKFLKQEALSLCK